MLDCLFQNGQMVCGGTMYDTTDVYACKYSCSKEFLYDVLLRQATEFLLIKQFIHRESAKV